ncbi:MAG TPA: glycosyltransferase family 4 protein [Acidimicrobiales bacterium]|nr:glycosyltransferase family 4 protein [Acidimicrobiales bacterium]
MRVALVCPYDLAAPGGVQGQVTGLARALAELGCEVIVVAPVGNMATPATGVLRGARRTGAPSRSPAGDAARRDLRDGDRGPDDLAGLHLVAAGSTIVIRANGSRAPVALSPLAARRSLAAVREWGPDVVHVHEPLVPAVALCAALSRIAPTIGTFHRAGSSTLYRAARPLARLCLARLDAVVAVSQAARSTLVAVAGGVGGRCAIVPNGIAVGRFATAEPWPSAGPTVVFVGRHEHRKGLAVLLDAFGALPPSTRLWVVGDGPQTGALRARSRRAASGARVEWCGRLGDAELARRVAGADVLVAPSLGGESFGVVLLEAMAAGTAVVASDLEGYRLAAGAAARYAEPGDAAGLARALGEVLADRATCDALVDAGRRRAEECSIGSVAREYLERYDTISR